MKNGQRYALLGIAAIVASVASVLLVPVSLAAHHGTGISYEADTWTTKATIVSFKYINPHPFIEFTRVNEKGETEHWSGDFATNPSFLIRNGWTKSRSEAALKAGTVVDLTLSTSRAGGTSGLIRQVRNDKGELVVNSRDADPTAGDRGGAGPAPVRQ